ncbi:unnamed protein product [Brassica oleracea]|uniref:(rape) hypothetical protein n=1 Tax=Brassica napus TaxID=3708 RepID=A0A816IKX0_BRANA|nr:unnamed protein product [Brassica napus]
MRRGIFFNWRFLCQRNLNKRQNYLLFFFMDYLSFAYLPFKIVLKKSIRITKQSYIQLCSCDHIFSN